MANNRRTQSRRSRRSNRRNTNISLRRLNQAVTAKPIPARVPADPPRLVTTIENSGVVQIKLEHLASQSTNNLEYSGNLFIPGRYNVVLQDPTSYNIVVAPFRYSELYECLVNQYAVHTAVQERLELCINKISLWGYSFVPTITANGAQVAILDNTVTFVVDLGAGTGSTTVHDAGTPARRARCGVTFPYKLWVTPYDNKEHFMEFMIGDGKLPGGFAMNNIDILNLGELRISVSWRITALLGTDPAVTLDATKPTAKPPPRK